MHWQIARPRSHYCGNGAALHVSLLPYWASAATSCIISKFRPMPLEQLSCKTIHLDDKCRGEKQPSLKKNKNFFFLLFTISFCYTVFPMLGLCDIWTTCIIHDANAQNELYHGKTYDNTLLIFFFSYPVLLILAPGEWVMKPTQKRKYIISIQTTWFYWQRVTPLLLMYTASQLSCVAM